MFSNAASSAELNGKHVNGVGSHTNSSTAYFGLAEGLPDCLYEIVYIDLSTNGGRAAFATVLSARGSGEPLTKIGYTKQTNGTCTLDIVSG